MKYYAIGDIHGKYNKLVKLLEKINYGEDGLIVFLGDYVDRGRQSRKVISLIKELVEANKAVALLGNHDEAFYKWCFNEFDSEEEELFWYNNYLKVTKNSYYNVKGFDYSLLQDHCAWLKTLPHFYETTNYFFCHSGCPFDFLWGRPTKDVSIKGKYTIHGHTPLEEPFIGKNRANLDTGAAWKKGLLTCGVWVDANRTPYRIVQSD